MKKYKLLHGIWVPLILLMIGINPARAQLTREQITQYTKDKAAYMDKQELTLGEKQIPISGTKMMMAGAWFKINETPKDKDSRFLLFKLKFDAEPKLRSALYYWEDGDDLVFRYIQTTAAYGINRVTKTGELLLGGNSTDEAAFDNYEEFRIAKSSYNYASDSWNYFSVGHQHDGFTIALNGKKIFNVEDLQIGLSVPAWNDDYAGDVHNHYFYSMTYGSSKHQYYIKDVVLYLGDNHNLTDNYIPKTHRRVDVSWGPDYDKYLEVNNNDNFYSESNTVNLYNIGANHHISRVLYLPFDDDKKNIATTKETAIRGKIIDEFKTDLGILFAPLKNYYEKTPKVSLEIKESCKLRINLEDISGGHYDVKQVSFNKMSSPITLQNGTPAYFDYPVGSNGLNGTYKIYDYTNRNELGSITLNTEKFTENASYTVTSAGNKIKVGVKIPDLVCMPKVEIFRNNVKVYTYTQDQYKSNIEFEYEDSPPIGSDYNYTVVATLNGNEYPLKRNGTGKVSISNVAITEFTNNVILNEENGTPAVKLIWKMGGNNIENNFDILKNGKKMTEIEIINSPANPKEFYIIDKSAFDADKAYSYEVKYTKNGISKLQTVKLLSGIPQETFTVSRDENRMETAALSWQTPTFTNTTPAIEFTKFTTGKSASIAWFQDFYSQNAQKYTAAVLARYNSGSTLFSFPALGITATYNTGKVKLELKSAGGTTQNTDIDYDLTANKSGQPYPKWNMFTFVYDRGTFKAYINYDLLYTGKLDNIITPTNDFFKIENANVDVKQVQIWNMTLSTDNIVKMIGGTDLETMSPQPVMYYELNTLDGSNFRNIIANSYPNMSTNGITNTDIKSETMQIASYDFLGYNIYLGEERVNSIAVSDEEFKVGAGFDYNYTKAVPCKENTYLIAPVFAGGVGKKNEIKLTIEPKYEINNVDATDAVYQNKVKIMWDETPSVSNYYIFRDDEKIAEVGKDDLKFVDFEAIPGVYHKYVIQGVSECSKSNYNDTTATDVGFVFPLGNISGTVKSPNGNPVMDVFVETDTIFGHSLSNGILAVPLDTLNNKAQFQETAAFSFWSKGNIMFANTVAEGKFKDKNSLIAISKGKLKITFYDDNNNEVEKTIEIPNTEEWNHYIFANDGIRDRVYVNGYLINLNNIGQVSITNSKSFSFAVGKFFWGIGEDGWIDELAIWNKNPYGATFNGKNFVNFPFVNQYIYGDSETEKSRFNNIIRSTLSGKEDGLIAYYRFDEPEYIFQVFEGTKMAMTFNQAQWMFNTFEKNFPIRYFGLSDDNCPELKNSAFTNDKGIYELANVNFNDVDGYLFGVSASKKTESLEHDITPKFVDAKINTSTRNRDGIAFTDNSLYPVSGKVYYHQFIKEAEYPKGVVSLFNAEILVDGEEQRPPVITAQDGTFTAEVEPGMHIFSMKPYERTIAQTNSSVTNPSSSINEGNARDSVEIVTSTVIENFMVPAEDKLTARYKSNVTADRKGYKLIVDDFNVWAEVNFEDSASYELEVTFKGRCDFEVGAYDVELESTDGKFKYMVKNNTDIKTVIKNLPPLEYKVTLVSHNKLEIDPQTVDLQKGNNKIEFIYRNPLQVSVRKMSQAFNDKNTFDKATAHTGLPYVFVTENSVNKEMYMAKKGDKILMYVDVFEEYNSKRCPVDSATIKIINNLGEGGEIIADTMYIPAKEGEGPWSDKELCTATVGDPNISGEMLKDIQVSVTDNTGRNLTKKFDMFVVGSVLTDKTFATVPHTIPLMWLVDPPGDKSYSYIEAGSEICKSSEVSVDLSADVKFGVELKASPKISIIVGLGLVPGPELKTDVKPVMETTTGTTINHTSTWTTKVEVCASFNEKIQTSDDDAIVGPDADVFVGLGINYVFGEGKTTSFDWTNKKKNDVESSVILSNDEIQTMYVYNRATINNQVKENSQSLFDYYLSFAPDNDKNKINKAQTYKNLNPVTGENETYDGQTLLNKIAYYERSKQNWEDIVSWFDYEKDFINQQEIVTDNNFSNIWDNWKDEANDITSARDFEDLSLDTYTSNASYLDLLHQNISFGYGSNYSADVNLSSSREEGYTMGFSLEASLDTKMGIEVGDAGSNVTGGATGKTSTNTVWNATEKNTAAVGVFLSDDDPGDIFSVSIYKDNKRGTLYFNTEGGQSSCPWEEKTQAREAVNVSALNVIDNIPYDQAAYVEIELQNKSQTGEDGDYYIMQLLQSNPGGLKFTVNGAKMGGNKLPIRIPEDGGVLKLGLLAERTRSDLFNYEPITFRVLSQCRTDFDDDIYEGDNLPEKADINIEFKWNKPCLSALEIFEKNESQLLNTSTEGKQFIPSFYVDPIRADLKANATKLQVQIAGAETNDWTGIDGLLIEENSTTHSIEDVLAENEYDKLVWNGGNYADGLYKIRIKAECKDGTIGASNELPLRIARNRTVLLGTPQPVDNMLSNDDQISALFSNPLSCGDIVDWEMIGHFPGSRYPVFAQSLYFDGGDHIVLDKPFEKDLKFVLTDEFMITAWIKPMVKDKKQTIISTLKGAKGVHLFINAQNQLVFEMQTNIGTKTAVSTDMITVGEWQFVFCKLVSNSNGKRSLLVGVNQVNSDQKAEIDNTYDMKGGDNIPFILAQETTATNDASPFFGYIDDVRVFGKDGFTEANTKKTELLSGGNVRKYWRLDDAESLNFPTANASQPKLTTDIPAWQYLVDDYTEKLNNIVTLACYENELAFVLPNDLHRRKQLENIQIDVIFNSVYDIYKNKAYQDARVHKDSTKVKWSFMVNRNSMKWEIPDLDIVKYTGETKTFTMDLWNNGGENEDFELLSLPSWLKAEPATGTILPGGKKTITFTVLPTANQGLYKDEVYAENNEGWEPLLINLRVICPQPQWEVNPADYDQSMVITSELEGISLDNTILDQYAIAAYYGNRVVGKGSVMKTENGKYNTVLMVYDNSDISATKQLEIHLWNPLECMEKIANNFIQFEANSNYTGKIIFSDKAVKEYQLAEGWNWISCNLTSDAANNAAEIGKLNEVISSPDFTSIRQVKHITDYANNTGRFDGTLQTLSNQSGYLVKASKPVTMRITGQQFDIENSILNLQKNWNLISYLPNGTQKLSDVFLGLNLTDGDMVKSHTQYAVYRNKSWFGDLEYMEPGKGYFVKVTNPIALKYRDVDYAKLPKKRGDATNPFWQFNSNKFMSTMTVTAQVEHEGTKLWADNYQVGAFVGQECRGVAQATVADDGIAFYLSVHGDTKGENISFKLVNTFTGEVFEINETYTSNPNEILGYPTPVLLTTSDEENTTGIFNTQASDEQMLAIYPNPFNDELNIEFSVAQSQNISIELYSVQGKFVGTLYNGKATANLKQTVKLNAAKEVGKQLATGVYMCVLRLEDGTLQSKQIIRK